MEETQGTVPAKRKFEYKKYLIKVQGNRMYLPVSARLIWLRMERPEWGITTDPFVIDIERQYAIFRATITDENGRILAQATKREDIRGFPDYVEKAETGAVGRALALCGFGTQFTDELDEVKADRLVDSPQPTRQPTQQGAPQGNRSGQGNRAPAAAPQAEQQQTNAPACGKCSKPLTRSQQELSVRHYGEPLCPACQKDRPQSPTQAARPAHA